MKKLVIPSIVLAALLAGCTIGTRPITDPIDALEPQQVEAPAKAEAE